MASVALAALTSLDRMRPQWASSVPSAGASPRAPVSTTPLTSGRPPAAGPVVRNRDFGGDLDDRPGVQFRGDIVGGRADQLDTMER